MPRSFFEKLSGIGKNGTGNNGKLSKNGAFLLGLKI